MYVCICAIYVYIHIVVYVWVGCNVMPRGVVESLYACLHVHIDAMPCMYARRSRMVICTYVWICLCMPLCNSYAGLLYVMYMCMYACSGCMHVCFFARMCACWCVYV